MVWGKRSVLTIRIVQSIVVLIVLMITVGYSYDDSRHSEKNIEPFSKTSITSKKNTGNRSIGQHLNSTVGTIVGIEGQSVFVSLKEEPDRIIELICSDKLDSPQKYYNINNTIKILWGPSDENIPSKLEIFSYEEQLVKMN